MDPVTILRNEAIKWLWLSFPGGCDQHIYRDTAILIPGMQDANRTF